MRSALRLYTSSWRYLYGVKVGAERVDLDGNPCGVLEEQHVEHARKQLEEAKARVQAQRAEQQAKSAKLPLLRVKRQSHVAHVRQVKPAPRREAGAAPENRKPRQSPRPQQVRPPRPQVEENQPRPVPVTDISKLQIGQEIKVRAGKSAMDATVLEIAKDGVRVQLSSGLAMIVRAEHLQF